MTTEESNDFCSSVRRNLPAALRITGSKTKQIAFSISTALFLSIFLFVVGFTPVVASRFRMLVFPFLLYAIILLVDAIIDVVKGYNKVVSYVNLASALNFFALFAIVACSLYYPNKYPKLWIFAILYLLIELGIDFGYHRAWLAGTVNLLLTNTTIVLVLLYLSNKIKAQFYLILITPSIAVLLAVAFVIYLMAVSLAKCNG
jgi:hypothetical protein